MKANLTATEATDRNWCNYCPDLILPGEIAASADGFLNPLGEEGFAHADCATRAGHNVTGDAEPVSPMTFARQRAREQGSAVDALIVADEESP